MEDNPVLQISITDNSLTVTHKKKVKANICGKNRIYGKSNGILIITYLLIIFPSLGYAVIV